MPKRLPSRIKLKINHPQFRLELEGGDPQQSIREINKLMTNLSALTEEQLDYDDPHWEGYLSPELSQRKDVRKLLDNYAQLYGHYHLNKVAIPNQQILELGKRQVLQNINFKEVQLRIQKLLFGIEKEKVNFAIVHVKGNNTKEDVQKIVDFVQKQLPLTTIKPIVTKEKLPDTLVEGIFFGEFEHPEEEEY